MGCAATSLVVPRLDNGQAKPIAGAGAEAGAGAGEVSTSPLTDRQKARVRKTWKILSNDLAGRGTKVFRRIFEMNPAAKQLFPFRDIEGEELLKDPCFKGHASRFMQAVGAAVDNLDDLQCSFAPLLLGLGRQHIHYKGLQPELFQAFIDSMMYMVETELRSRYTKEAGQAWRLVFEYIVNKLREGYYQALDEAEAAKELPPQQD